MACPEYPWRISILFYFYFLLLGLHLQHMEAPRLGAELELQLPAYTIATTTPDLSHIYNLHRSLQQHWILNLLSEVRDQTLILMDPSPVLNPLSHKGNVPFLVFLNQEFCLLPVSLHSELPAEVITATASWCYSCMELPYFFDRPVFISKYLNYRNVPTHNIKTLSLGSWLGIN